MTRDDYNSFVQDAQAFAIAAGLDHRIDSDISDDGKIYARFQVYWDGWKTLAQEDGAMHSDCRRFIWEDVFDRVRFEVAGEVAKVTPPLPLKTQV